MLNTPEEWAANFGITLTDAELWLVSTRSSLLDRANREIKHRLLLALRPETCPACAWRVCERSTWTGTIPIPAETPNNGPGYTCPNCETGLVHKQGHTTPDRHLMELPPDAEPPLVVEQALPPGAPEPGLMLLAKIARHM
jgi:hypothetical protein